MTALMGAALLSQSLVHPEGPLPLRLADRAVRERGQLFTARPELLVVARAVQQLEAHHVATGHLAGDHCLVELERTAPAPARRNHTQALVSASSISSRPSAAGEALPASRA